MKNWLNEYSWLVTVAKKPFLIFYKIIGYYQQKVVDSLESYPCSGFSPLNPVLLIDLTV